jgi:hypothetical protein
VRLPGKGALKAASHAQRRLCGPPRSLDIWRLPPSALDNRRWTCLSLGRPVFLSCRRRVIGSSCLGSPVGVDQHARFAGDGTKGRPLVLRVRVMRDLSSTTRGVAHLFAAPVEGLTRCVSIADASLSLSLSLSSPGCLAARALPGSAKQPLLDSAGVDGSSRPQDFLEGQETAPGAAACVGQSC